MSARADVRLAILVAATLVAAPTVVWAAAASNDPPSAERAQQILDQNRPLAEHGDASAQYNMGVLYDQGYGVARDYAKARRWYEKAAAQHYPRAEHNLGILYEAGKGVPRDRGKAAHWFRRGADDGQSASQNNLAVLYMKGEGVPQNTGKAAFWAARAAAGGNSAAIDNLPRIVSDLPHVHVNADDVNVRDQPNREARVVGHVDSDTVAVVLARRNDWTQILLPDDYTLGWVANFLLSDSQAPLAGGDVPTPESPQGGQAATAGAEQPRDTGEDGHAPQNKPRGQSRESEKRPPAHTGSQGFAVDRRKQTGPVAAPTAIEPKPAPKNTPEPANQPAHQADKSVRSTSSTVAKPSGQSKPSAPTHEQSAPGDEQTATTDQPPRSVESDSPVQPDEAQAASTPAAAKTTATHATVGVDAANLRGRAGHGGQVIGQLHRGDRVKLLDEHNGWRRVRTSGGMTGWIAGYLLVVQ